jgi:predicted nucleic acid-binding Zn ribbon protein
MSDPPRKKCPECGGKVTRLIGRGGGVILKGAGFYTTDYRSDSYRSAAKKDSDASKPASEGKKDAPAARKTPDGAKKKKKKKS